MSATGMLFNLPLAFFLLQAQLRASLASPACFWLQTVLYAALLGVAAFGSLYAILACFKRCGESEHSAGKSAHKR
jgi:hypothetical protein